MRDRQQGEEILLLTAPQSLNRKAQIVFSEE
jgi:hypothetical protein